MTDFKIGEEQVQLGARLNDAVSEAMGASHEDPVAAIAESLGVDTEALTDTAMARSHLLIAGTVAELQKGRMLDMPAEFLQVSMISSAWLDGFFAALHIIEQKIHAGDLTEAT